MVRDEGASSFPDGEGVKGAVEGVSRQEAMVRRFNNNEIGGLEEDDDNLLRAIGSASVQSTILLHAVSGNFSNGLNNFRHPTVCFDSGMRHSKHI